MWLKWFGIVIVLLVVAFIGFRAFIALVYDPRVIEELQNDPGGERAGIVMLLTFPDGRVLPVNYLQEGNLVFAGADGRWWRALRAGNVPVTLLIRGETLTGRARVVLDDPEYKHDVFQRLRPNAPEWLPDWLNAHLVVIDLDSYNVSHPPSTGR